MYMCSFCVVEGLLDSFKYYSRFYFTMPRKPEPRKGMEIRQTRIVSRPRRIFGTQGRVKSAKYIGIQDTGEKFTHWHVDRRRKKGTVDDRKK